MTLTLPLRRRDKEKTMYRLQGLIFAAVLMTSATAFAADVPDPSNSKGEATLPTGSNEGTPPVTNSGDTAVDKTDSNADATPTPPMGEKGSSDVVPQ
jgi:hypothetical protein